ncbi:MAG: YdiU family protein, partial [Candidatus Eremiobacteraeota bacterium]|nr:YdiU family protein [Candidatus Eremiobacteraeota bacterium]
AKFGLAETRDGDTALFADCFTTLQNGRVDHTNFFRALSSLTAESTAADDALALAFENRSEWYDWQRAYRERLRAESRSDDERHRAMKRANPKFVLRNYLAQQAIAAAENHDYTEIARLHDVLRAPFDERPGDERYAQTPPDWAAHIEVSCSS